MIVKKFLREHGILNEDVTVSGLDVEAIVKDALRRNIEEIQDLIPVWDQDKEVLNELKESYL